MYFATFSEVNIYGSRRVMMIMISVMCCASCYSQSNEGRDFWFGFMEHRDVGENDMVVMLTSRTNTTGVIAMPGFGFSQEFSVAANDVTVIELPTTAETVGSEFIGNNAINITSNDDISVYMHQFFGMRSEASVVLPVNALGSSYYAIAFSGVQTQQLGNHPSEFLIVATEDETSVTYTLGATSQGGRAAGSTHSVVLNTGELYQVRALDALDDLTGSFIRADKDIALFAGTAWSQVPTGCGAMDNLLEQMYPISTWGTRYVASPFARTSVDLYRIIAAEDDTRVQIEGSFLDDVTLDAGEFLDFQASDGIFVESDQAISVAQYIMGSNCNGGVGDPSMVVLNTVEQIRDTVTLFNSRFFDIQEQYINVTARTGEEDLIFIDGLPLRDLPGVVISPIGSGEEFTYAIAPVTAGAHTLWTSGCGIIAMAYGYGNIESYAYSGGASFLEINENQIPPGGCLNDTIFFDTGLPEDRFDVFWDLGDGTTTSEHVFEYQYDELGNYPVSLIIDDLCFGEIDTNNRDLMVTLRQDLTAIDEAAGCEGSDIQLEAFDLSGATFEWTGPEEYEAEEQFPIIESITFNQQGVYQVIGNISGCKTFPEDVFVEVYENPTPDIGEDLVLCPLDGDRATVEAGEYEGYVWQDGTTEPSLEIDEAGDVWVEVTDELGCTGVDSLVVIQQCPTRFYIPNIFSPNGDGVNDYFGVAGIELTSMRLQVYDGWGQLIFQSVDESVLWDGTFRGDPVTIGEYTWRFLYTGYDDQANQIGDDVTGTILVVR